MPPAPLGGREASFQHLLLPEEYSQATSTLASGALEQWGTGIEQQFERVGVRTRVCPKMGLEASDMVCDAANTRRGQLHFSSLPAEHRSLPSCVKEVGHLFVFCWIQAQRHSRHIS